MSDYTTYEEVVRSLAHQKWIEENYPEGKDKEHWQLAEAELLSIVDVLIQGKPPKKSKK